MRTIIGWLVGVIMGSVIGTVIGILFASEADEETSSRLQKALSVARTTGQKRRVELEAELAQMQEYPNSENGK